QAVRAARDPFYPRIAIGSGLAYTNGFPMSVEGSAPSVVQANAVAYLFNRPQSFQIAMAKENARGASIGVGGKREEVAWRVASLYLDAERTGRARALARKDADSLEKVLDIIRNQVREGRALPLAEKTSAFNLARARQIASALEDDQATGEIQLALALGFAAEDRVHPAEEERPAPALPREDQAVQAALEASQDLRRIQCQITAKQLEV